MDRAEAIRVLAIEQASHRKDGLVDRAIDMAIAALLPYARTQADGAAERRMIMANSCKDCKHDKGKCVGVSRAGSHRYCFEQKEMTNADRIRAMSDEELVKEMRSHAFALAACSERAWLEWLKQPAGGADQ